MFEIGTAVRLRGNLTRHGQVKSYRKSGNRSLVAVQFPDGVRTIPAEQLEPVPIVTESAVDLIKIGNLSPPRNLRKLISHSRLSGKLVDMIYSMEATDTQFFAHQFKPVLKLLASPTGNLLIADEVGLGKTIEAGLIWTELAARFNFRRLVIICPKVLCTKWQDEMETKFGLNAQIMNPVELADCLAKPERQKRGFVAICGMQSIRPRPKEDRKSTNADILADIVDAIEEFDPRIDLLIVDEAHHLRNPGTQTNLIGPMFARLSLHTVMLSATPINLRDRDLYTLLKLVDSETFHDERALEQIINANAPIVAAKDAIQSGQTSSNIYALILEASRHPLLNKTKQIQSLRSDVANLNDPISNVTKVDLVNRLEKVNLLSNIITRTRRRDVDEFRVHRHVAPYRVQMHPIEREVYEIATQAILNYADQNDLPTGFLTVMPQRMLASCLPATIEHWVQKSGFSVYEDADIFEEQKKSTPFLDMLGQTCQTLPSANDLWHHDSKFEKFIAVLKEHLETHSSDKVIVFSTFKTTLRYLEKRLCQEKIENFLMHGDTKDRMTLVGAFQKSTTTRVFLSSEVGSEGIDLQFARCVVNYDLPWNPMRVEQRIGRIDRLGQEAEAIAILNLFHADTIDDRIYTRLYDRLNLCERALGGFEEILGKEISKLTAALLSNQLNEEEKNSQAEMAAQVIASRIQEEESLETEAASLFAHGDFILNSIKEARDAHRWISDTDIVDYIRDALGSLFIGSTLIWTKEQSKVEILLTGEAKHKYEMWCKANNLEPGPLASPAQSIEFQLGKSTIKSRKPKLNQNHPFMQFISFSISNSGLIQEDAIGIEILEEHLEGIKAGVYVGGIQTWKFGQGGETEKLGYALLNVQNKEFVKENLLETLVSSCIENGSHWFDTGEDANLVELGSLIEQDVIENLETRFFKEEERRIVDTEDRVAIQIASLEKRAEEDRRKIQQQIMNSSSRMRAANEGRLSALERRVDQRKLKLNEQLVFQSEFSNMCGFALKVKASH